MLTVQYPFSWMGPSPDPNDVQLGHLVERIDLTDGGDYEVVLLGEPYDDAVVSRRGASQGPVEIRMELAETHAFHFESGSLPSIGDLGDVEFPGDRTVRELQIDLEAFTGEVHDLDALPVFLGGDNSLSVPNVSPLLAEGETAVVNFDAHLDCREVPEEPTSGTPFRQLIERGLDQYVVVGARHFETSGRYAEYVAENGGTVYTVEDVMAGVGGVIDEIESTVETADSLFLSLDMDVFDAGLVQGVSAPTPGGLPARTVFDMLHSLARARNLSGIEVLECAPPLDVSEQTARTASRAIAHALAGAVGE